MAALTEEALRQVAVAASAPNRQVTEASRYQSINPSNHTNLGDDELWLLDQVVTNAYSNQDPSKMDAKKAVAIEIRDLEKRELADLKANLKAIEKPAIKELQAAWKREDVNDGTGDTLDESVADKAEKAASALVESLEKVVKMMDSAFLAIGKAQDNLSDLENLQEDSKEENDLSIKIENVSDAMYGIEDFSDKFSTAQDEMRDIVSEIKKLRF